MELLSFFGGHFVSFVHVVDDLLSFVQGLFLLNATGVGNACPDASKKAAVPDVPDDAVGVKKLGDAPKKAAVPDALVGSTIDARKEPILTGVPDVSLKL